MVGFLKAILEDHGIDCIIKNEHLCGAVGELPPIECWPEIWLTDESNYTKACTLIDNALHADERGSKAWRCPNCGEVIEGQFTDCWNCGHARFSTD